jgi:site-specific recombinase XerD
MENGELKREDGIGDFLEELRRKGRSSGTITNYRLTLEQWSTHLQEQNIFSSFTASEKEFFSWRTALIEEHRCSILTAQCKLLKVYTFYEWLRQTGVLLINPLPRPSLRHLTNLPREIPDESAIKVAYSKLRNAVEHYEQRDYVMLDIGFSCGLRRCELQALNLQDVNVTEGTLRVRGKGGKVRLVPLGEKTLADLQHYIYHIRPHLLKTVTSALFVSWQRKERMNSRSINRAFMRVRKKFNLDMKITPHALRHAYATSLIRNGAPVQDVSKMLGHVKLETTQVYTHLVPVDLKNHHHKFHPRG